MGELSCKTWQNRSPVGLISVFFCATKEDRESYFEELTDMILELRKNVAIYYSENIEDLTDEAFDRMRLLIVPVTYAFMKPDCRERLEIFNRFVEENIPVLPILEESGLFSYFNEVCGNIQVLDGTGQDDTAIPFNKKLEKFLDSILIGDETVQKIREAFDAYIFLSYRKKDRKHAEKIMHLIHDNPFMRDVAIWYDEYLVPGEQFDEAIRDAMLKSKLVALLVTPNLVNEDNYIRRIEYPMAVENGKPIIPIEAEPTDKKLLLEIYNGIGEIPPADKPDEITRRLAEMFHTEGIKENNDPEHLYFIGMAYLLGIDVEVDEERAWALIYKAAEAGLDAAYIFYVDCFMEGRFVKRDYEKARDWQWGYVSLMLDENGNWDWNMYPESNAARREVCYEYAVRLNRLVEIMIACNGVTEDAINWKKTEIEALDSCMELLDPELVEEYKSSIPEDEDPAEWVRMSVRSFVIPAKEELLIMLCDTAYPSYEDEIEKLYDEIIQAYIEYNDYYGFYQEKWDLSKFCCNVGQAMSKYFSEYFDPLTFFYRISEIWLPYYNQYFEQISDNLTSEDDKVVQTNYYDITSILYCWTKLETSFIQWVIDRVTDEVPTENRKSNLSQTAYDMFGKNIKDALSEQRELLEELCGNLTDLKCEEKRDHIRQEFFRAYGRLMMYMGEYNEAGKLFLEAFQELKDRFESPENIRGQMTNLRNIIEYGREINDMLLVYNGYWELEEQFEELFYGTGDKEALKKFYEDLDKVWKEPELAKLHEARGNIVSVEKLLAECIKKE